MIAGIRSVEAAQIPDAEEQGRRGRSHDLPGFRQSCRERKDGAGNDDDEHAHVSCEALSAADRQTAFTARSIRRSVRQCRRDISRISEHERGQERDPRRREEPSRLDVETDERQNDANSERLEPLSAAAIREPQGIEAVGPQQARRDGADDQHEHSEVDEDDVHADAGHTDDREQRRHGKVARRDFALRHDARTARVAVIRRVRHVDAVIRGIIGKDDEEVVENAEEVHQNEEAHAESAARRVRQRLAE